MLLIRNQQPRNSSTGKRTNRPGDHSTERDAGNITGSAGCNLRQNTDLVTQGADVGETTERVGGDEARTGGEISEVVIFLEARVGDEFILDIDKFD